MSPRNTRPLTPVTYYQGLPVVVTRRGVYTCWIGTELLGAATFAALRDLVDKRLAQAAPAEARS